MKLLEFFGYRKLHNAAAGVERRVKLPDPEALKNICVLWRPPEEQAFQFLHDHFLHTKAIFRNICVMDKNSIFDSATNVITPRDLTRVGLPKEGIADEFLKTEFDLLLNVAMQQNLVLDYLTALSRARFKIGCSKSAHNFFDLNIEIGGNEDSLYLARQQIFYLDQLNKTKVT